MQPRTLILGWGNPGRLDDGLGPAFTRQLAERCPDGATIDSGYQLTMEDAAEVARYDRVLFVDADRTGPAPFRMQPVEPSRNGSSFSTHSISPGAVLALSRDLFDAEPQAWVLGIRGYAFDEFGEQLTDRAQANLEEAVRFVESAIEAGTFEERVPLHASREG
ncbi:MAG: hydrogenase maturation protease [bacterium]|nr:hydrogenase maturation protease [bacterium]